MARPASGLKSRLHRARCSSRRIVVTCGVYAHALHMQCTCSAQAMHRRWVMVSWGEGRARGG